MAYGIVNGPHIRGYSLPLFIVCTQWWKAPQTDNSPTWTEGWSEGAVVDRKRLIVLPASLQLYKTQGVLYGGLVLAYIALGPSTKGEEGKLIQTSHWELLPQSFGRFKKPQTLVLDTFLKWLWSTDTFSNVSNSLTFTLTICNLVTSGHKMRGFPPN